MRTPWLLLVALGCGSRLPPSPIEPDTAWQIDRGELPGGTLRAFHTATVGMKEKQALRGGDGQDFRAPVTVYLLEHPSEGWVLIDAGFGRVTADDPHAFPGRLASKLLDIRDVRPLVDELGDVGIEAGDIDQIFITHLHTDHAGGVADLPEAVVRVPQEEWDAASEPAALKGYEPSPYAGHAFEPVVFDDGPYAPFRSTTTCLATAASSPWQAPATPRVTRSTW
jgi:glyoxylase-like metal-dependent hydrolase (beta-lactamase superfamily II)